MIPDLGWGSFCSSAFLFFDSLDELSHLGSVAQVLNMDNLEFDQAALVSALLFYLKSREEIHTQKVKIKYF